MKLPIELLSQKDPRWASKKLGTSTSSIGNYGCVITSLSMFCTYWGHSIFPDELNDKLVAIDGFSNKNLMKWEKLSEIYPDIKWEGRIDCLKTPAPLEKIDEYLNKKMPVVAMVDFNPQTREIDQHFVLIIGKDNADYFIADPWTGEVYFLSAKYGEPKKAICGLRLYSSIENQNKPSTPAVPPQNSSLEVEKKINELSEKVVNNANQVNTLNDGVGNVVRKIDDLQKDITEIYKDMDTLATIQSKLTENTNSINNVSVANTKSTTELKAEIRVSKELTEAEVQALEKRVKALESGHQIEDGKFEFIKKILGKYYVVKLK